MTAEQREGLGRRLVDSARSEWQEAKAAGMDSMWKVIQQVAHEFHTGASGMELKEATRGKAQWEDELPKLNTGTADASTLALRAVAKRKRKLQHLHALTLRGPGASKVGRRALLDALDKAGPPEFQEKLRQAAGDEALVWALVVQTRVQEDELLVEHRKERRNQWHEWVTTCFASNQRRLYAWIREGPKAVKVSPPTQRRDGSWRVGLQGQMEAVEEAWWHLC